jgi:pimeloyl-ACP methyl ester carboxylesterase
MAIDNRTSILVLACLIGTVGLGTFGPAAAGTLGGPLELADEGSFFVGGQMARSTNPSNAPGATPGQIMINQMYVQYRIPRQVSGPSIIMVHGSGHTGVTYETTPDGREGWATYFTRKGFPVYLVDHSGRGRSGFDPTVINSAKAETNVALLPPDIPLTTRERAWQNFRFGDAYPTPYPGLQFPVEALDQYVSQLVPNTETTLAGGGVNTVKALAALLDKIGPAIVMVHSQSGSYGLDLIRLRADKVRAFIDVEGNCGPLSADDVSQHFRKVPTLVVSGDNTVGSKTTNGDERRKLCTQTIDALKAAGGKGKYLILPEAGLKGNSHMMMMDKNNLQVADLIIGWIGEVAGGK